MEMRLDEMLDRRRRLIKYTFKKEGRLASACRPEAFEALYQEALLRKNGVVQRFSGAQLEDLLKTSTKNVAQEVVSCMIPLSEEVLSVKGLLHELEKLYPEAARERRKIAKESFKGGSDNIGMPKS